MSRIVYFDDNATTCEIVTSVLEGNLNCEVVTCSKSYHLFNLPEGQVVDLFLLDVSSDDQGGAVLCRNLKETEGLRDIPIILISSYKDPVRRVEGLKAGAVDYIDKPFYPEELVTRLGIHLKMQRLGHENLDRIKEQQSLLRVLCHDLINPVFAAHSLLELRRSQGKVDDRTVGIVIDSCKSAMDIVQNVREQHALVSVDKRREDELVPIAEAFEESAKTLGVRFESKGVDLVLDCPALARIRINRVILVSSILNNLLTNALKFSHRGSKVMLSSSIEAVDGKQFARVSVSDEGIGMPQEILENLFREGAKVSRSGTESEEGTGFGMPLVKRYVEGAGGRISVVSCEEGSSSKQGTTVTLWFPLDT